jgi:RimJ/RimL family protein N-acetyltransferase
MIYYNWTNDAEVRNYSYNSNPVNLETHTAWFQRKIQDPNVLMLIFANSRNELIGQARIESINEESIIGVSVDVNHRGKGYASRIIELTSAKFYEMKKKSISAYIKVENIASIKAFEEAGYGNKMLVNIQGNESLKLTYK